MVVRGNKREHCTALETSKAPDAGEIRALLASRCECHFASEARARSD